MMPSLIGSSKGTSRSMGARGAGTLSAIWRRWSSSSASVLRRADWKTRLAASTTETPTAPMMPTSSDRRIERIGPAPSSVGQHVADAANRPDAMSADLAAQRVHGDPDRVAPELVRPAVDPVLQLRLGQHRAGAQHQGLEERELARREGHRLARHREAAVDRVEGELA